MKATELDPTRIRKQLAHLRTQRVPFDAAWTIVAGKQPVKRSDRLEQHAEQVGMRSFMEKHFRAAYNRTPSLNGRFGTESIEGRQQRARVPVECVPHDQRCKSGDGCDRKRGYGRTGLFCEHHAAELARIDMDVKPAAYRIFGTKAA